MKLLMSGREFKDMISRINSIVPKKPVNYTYDNIKLIAQNGKLTIQSTDVEDFGTISIYSDIINEGYAWINYGDLKKLSLVDDEVIITVDSAIFEIRSKKKTYQIPCHEDLEDVWAKFPTVGKEEKIYSADAEEILTHLKKLDCMRGSNKANIVTTGFYFDIPNRNLVVLDGHEACVARLSDCSIKSEKKLLVSGTFYKKLKGIVGKNKYSNIDFYLNKSYAIFKGEDWEYATRLVNGNFYNYESFFPNNDYNYEFNIDAKEFGKIAKEYSKAGSDNVNPMIIYNGNGKLATSLETPCYRTSDMVEIEPVYGMEKEWFSGFNPKYILNSCNVCDSRITVRGKYDNRTPIVLSDDTYRILILPIAINDTSADFAKMQVA